MNSKQLNKLLIAKFPELKKQYCQEVSWQEGDETGSHVVYGDVFAPYIEQLVSENNHKKLQEVFDFIEEILIQNEEYSDEVIMFSILERLMCDKDILQKCSQYFGKMTEKTIDNMR